MLTPLFSWERVSGSLAWTPSILLDWLKSEPRGPSWFYFPRPGIVIMHYYVCLSMCMLGNMTGLSCSSGKPSAGELPTWFVFHFYFFVLLFLLVFVWVLLPATVRKAPWHKQRKGRGDYFLTIPGYSPWWQENKNVRILKQLVTLCLESEEENYTTGISCLACILCSPTVQDSSPGNCATHSGWVKIHKQDNPT